MTVGSFSLRFQKIAMKSTRSYKMTLVRPFSDYKTFSEIKKNMKKNVRNKKNKLIKTKWNLTKSSRPKHT